MKHGVQMRSLVRTDRHAADIAAICGDRCVRADRKLRVAGKTGHTVTKWMREVDETHGMTGEGVLWKEARGFGYLIGFPISCPYR
jgi:hypothetical protein